MRFTAIILLFSLVLFSCKKDEGNEPSDFGYDYYPISVGHWQTYDVEEIRISDFDTSNIDTLNYQVREVIESTYTDLENRPTQRIERYRRNSDTADWVISDVWSSNRTVARAERVEENTRFIRLTFPVKEGATWDGNAFNTKAEEEHEYTKADVASTINGQLFNQTLTVVQVDDSNFIEQERSIEMYAKNVGLIYKHYKFIKSQGADSGIIMTMQIKDFGQQ